ncbi:hypothetical protein ACFLRF_00085 [Candidatus Altiarchaeota archaeon]
MVQKTQAEPVQEADGQERKPFSQLSDKEKKARLHALRVRLPSIKTLLDGYAEYAHRYGLPAAKAAAKEEALTEGHSQYSRLIQDAQEVVNNGGGLSLFQLGKRHKVSHPSVSYWLNGNKPRFLYNVPQVKPIKLPEQEDPDVAYMLGYMMGQVGGFPDMRLKIRQDDEQIRGRFTSTFNRLTGRKLKSESRTVDVRVPEFFDMLRRETDDKKHIPFGRLITHEERKAYLTGLFATPDTGCASYRSSAGKRYSRFSIARKAIDTPKGETPTYMTDLQILFMHVGVNSTIHYREKTNQWNLDVNDLASQKRLIQLDVLPKTKAEKMAKEIGSADRTEAAYSVAQYDAVMAHKNEMREGTVSYGFYPKVMGQVNQEMARKEEKGEAATATELGREPVEQWLKLGVVPNVAANRDKIRALEQETYGDVETFKRGQRKFMTRQMADKLEEVEINILHGIEKHEFLDAGKVFRNIHQICETHSMDEDKFLHSLGERFRPEKYDNMPQHQVLGLHLFSIHLDEKLYPEKYRVGRPGKK